MRHTAAFCDLFPVAAYIASLILYNPSATADVQKTEQTEFLKYFVLLSYLCLENSPVWAAKPYFRGNT